MVISLSIKDDLARLDRVLAKHEKALMKKAVPQAINRTLKTVRSHAVKDIAKTTGYRQKAIRDRIRVLKASAKTMSGALDARKGKAENLIEFVRPAQRNPQTFRKRTRKGFKYAGVKAKAWNQAKIYKGTFIGRNKAGEMKVYKRTGSSRGKITLVSGPSIRREFIEEQLVSSMKAIGRQRFRIELSAAINNQIRRQR